MYDEQRALSEFASGSPKIELNRWWTRVLKRQAQKFLASHGYEAEALREARDTPALRRNAALLEQALDAVNDPLGTRAWLTHVCTPIYARIDLFIEDVCFFVCFVFRAAGRSGLWLAPLTMIDDFQHRRLRCSPI
jgi:hypothetical protein